MIRAIDHTARKRAAEAEFRYHVDVPLLGGLGRLRNMLDWCGAHAAGAWDMYRHSERQKGARSLEYVRFYFTTEADAEAFISRRRRVN